MQWYDLLRWEIGASASRNGWEADKHLVGQWRGTVTSFVVTDMDVPRSLIFIGTLCVSLVSPNRTLDLKTANELETVSVRFQEEIGREDFLLGSWKVQQ